MRAPIFAAAALVAGPALAHGHVAPCAGQPAPVLCPPIAPPLAVQPIPADRPVRVAAHHHHHRQAAHRPKAQRAHAAHKPRRAHPPRHHRGHLPRAGVHPGGVVDHASAYGAVIAGPAYGLFPSCGDVIVTRCTSTVSTYHHQHHLAHHGSAHHGFSHHGFADQALAGPDCGWGTEVTTDPSGREVGRQVWLCRGRDGRWAPVQ